MLRRPLTVLFNESQSSRDGQHLSLGVHRHSFVDTVATKRALTISATNNNIFDLLPDGSDYFLKICLLIALKILNFYALKHMLIYRLAATNQSISNCVIVCLV